MSADAWPAPQDRPVILTIATPADGTVKNAAYGGWIMTQFDHAAGRAGRLIAGESVIRSVEELVFHAPLPIGTDFGIYAREIRRGRSSFTLELIGLADPDGAALPIASGRFAMVAIDANGKSRPF